jgi:hypothetical protein
MYPRKKTLLVRFGLGYRSMTCSDLAGPLHHLLVGTSTGNMIVYDHSMKLIWAAQLPTTPVQIGVCTVGGVRGLVASVGDFAELSLCYMGTDPPTQVCCIKENAAQCRSLLNWFIHRHMFALVARRMHHRAAYWVDFCPLTVWCEPRTIG